MPLRLGGARVLGERSLRPSQILFIFLLDHLQRRVYEAARAPLDRAQATNAPRCAGGRWRTLYIQK
jgi:hypothetical protein